MVTGSDAAQPLPADAYASVRGRLHAACELKEHSGQKVTTCSKACAVTGDDAAQPYLQPLAHLYQEPLVLHPLQRLDLLAVLFLCLPFLQHITQQQATAQRLGPVCVVIQHLVG